MTIAFTSVDGNKETPIAAGDDSFLSCTAWKCECGCASITGGGRIDNDRGVAAQAICLKCKRPAGSITVEYDTIFGTEEDRAVLQGRPRVYG